MADGDAEATTRSAATEFVDAMAARHDPVDDGAATHGPMHGLGSRDDDKERVRHDRDRQPDGQALEGDHGQPDGQELEGDHDEVVDDVQHGGMVVDRDAPAVQPPENTDDPCVSGAESEGRDRNLEDDDDVSVSSADNNMDMDITADENDTEVGAVEDGAVAGTPGVDVDFVMNWNGALESDGENPYGDEDDMDDEPMYTEASANPSCFRSLRRRLDKVTTWTSLLSILGVDGTLGFSEKQYFVMGAIVQTSSANMSSLMCSRSFRRTLRTTLIEYCYPASRIMYVNENKYPNRFSSKDTYVSPDNGGATAPENCVRLVMPTEWAKLDVVTYPVYDALYGEASRKFSQNIDIEDSALVRFRDTYLRRTAQVSTRLRGMMCTTYACIGDVVWFPCAKDPGLVDLGLTDWRIRPDKDSSGPHGVCVGGPLGPTFGIGMGGDWTRDEEASAYCDLPDCYASMEQFLTVTLSTHAERVTATKAGAENAEQEQTDNTVPETAGNTKYTTQASFTDDGQLLDLELNPGDTFTVLRPSKVSTKYVSVCLFHTSPVGGTEGIPRERFMWVKSELSLIHI